jgi:hypothetical protein
LEEQGAGARSGAGTFNVRSSAPLTPEKMNASPSFARQPAGMSAAASVRPVVGLLPQAVGRSLLEAPTMMSGMPSALMSPARPIREPKRAKP